MKRLILLAGIAVLLVVGISIAVFVWRADGGSSWTELRSVEELQKRFNEDEGSIRIVLLLSPT
jgi:hypothetical protein